MLGAHSKTKFRLLLAIAAVAGIGLVSCEPQESIYPLYTEKDLILNDTLLGTWEDSEGWGYTFEKSQEEDKGYILTVTVRFPFIEYQVISKAHLLRLGQDVFVDLGAAGMSPEGEARTKVTIPREQMEQLPERLSAMAKAGEVAASPMKMPYPLLPVHTFGRIKIAQNVSRVWMMDEKEVHLMYARHKLQLDFVGDEEGGIIVSPTAKLQKFALKHAEDKDIFSHTTDLCRKGLDCRLEVPLQKVRDDPGDVESMYELARAYMERDRFDDAWATWKRIPGLKPISDRYRWYLPSDLAEAFIRWGHAEEGVSVLKSHTDKYPKNGEAWWHLGQMYLEVNQVQDALAAFRKSAALKPEQANSHFWFALSYIQMGNFENARRELQESERLDGVDPRRATELRAIMYFAEGNYEAAEREFAAGKKPDLFWQVLVLRHLGKPDAARKLLDDNEKDIETTPWPGMRKPRFDFYRGQLSEADLLATIKPPKGQVVVGDFCLAYFDIGEHRLLAGDGAKAREFFQKAVDTHAFGYEEWSVANARLKQLSSQ